MHIKGFKISIRPARPFMTPEARLVAIKFLNDRNNVETANKFRHIYSSMVKHVGGGTIGTHFDQHAKTILNARRALRRALYGTVYASIEVELPPMSHKKRLKNKALGIASGPTIRQTTDVWYTDYNKMQLLCRAKQFVDSHRNDIQYYRRESRKIVTRHKSFTTRTGSTIQYEVTSGVSFFSCRAKNITGFREPNSIIKIQEARKASRILEHKLPKTDERHVSVEIEFACPIGRSDLIIALQRAELSDYVQRKDDGSLRDFPANYVTHELVVCMPVSKREEVLKRVCDVLEFVGAKVNKSCGLHVHLDMRHYDHTKAFSNLVSSQVILYQMSPVSRRTNTYCKKTISKDYSTARSKSDRYVGINPMSFNKHRTIEVRLHSGTTNYQKILNFVDILIAVGYNDQRIVRGASTVNGFAKQHNLSRSLVDYIQQRTVQFGGTSIAEETT